MILSDFCLPDVLLPYGVWVSVSGRFFPAGRFFSRDAFFMRERA